MIKKMPILSHYLLSTDNKRLKFIPGDAEMVGIANVSSLQKKKLVKELTSLDADYIIIDLEQDLPLTLLIFLCLAHSE